MLYQGSQEDRDLWEALDQAAEVGGKDKTSHRTDRHLGFSVTDWGVSRQRWVRGVQAEKAYTVWGTVSSPHMTEELRLCCWAGALHGNNKEFLLFTGNRKSVNTGAATVQRWGWKRGSKRDTKEGERAEQRTCVATTQTPCAGQDGQ